MEANTKPKRINNKLWRARRKAGLEQKQVAHLLDHKSCDQISRYERGARLPGFKTLLKLELIYRTPLRELFPEQYGTYRVKMESKFSSVQPFLSTARHSCEGDNGHICTYAAMLKQTKLTEGDLSRARRHAISFHEILSDAIRNERRRTTD